MNRLIGALAGLALTGLSMGALAHDKGGTGGTGSGYEGSTSGSATSYHSITGKVLESSGGKLTIVSKGTAIPFDVQGDTKFDGISSAKDLKPGDEVRASFELKNGTNELMSVAKVSGGGSKTYGGSAGPGY
ncbi:MAG: hypothetical protein QM765_35145 [Myxococcales bacterium]